jgi:hypothetical protein
MRKLLLVMMAGVLVYAVAGCGNDTPGPTDGEVVCTQNSDCLEGYICRNGQCIEKAACTDLDGDGYCDAREGCDICDDCNDNRADIHPGAEESCDGADNDCDGLTDEDCPCDTGETRPCGTDVGMCEKGEQSCQDGQWSECQGGVQPAAEEDCDDSLDNDCNGAVNEGCVCEEGESRSCGSDLGECTPGVQSCVEEDGEWHWSGCSGGTPPEDEVCDDGLDNDCDGSVDNGCPCDESLQDRRPCGLNTGICFPGVQHCLHGEWGPCQDATMPEDERCDGLDNDCDMLTDEGCDCIDGIFESCGTDVGDCRMGTRTCVNGKWTACEGEVGPITELCDSRDNDCDGDFDEDFLDLRQPCEAGLGICRVRGIFLCTQDKLAVECSATAGQGYPELCDQLDNDCDGETDEDFAGLGEVCSIGQGACFSSGITECDPSGGVRCSAPVIPPAPTELCDDIDNDCDGLTDENFPRRGLPCTAGIGECFVQGTYICKTDGSATECDAVIPPGDPETCDGKDNDCDGETDEYEETTQICTTACGSGVQVCTGGVYGPCSARQPTAEVCDYFDNNCNGQTDEGFPDVGTNCEAGVGGCRSLGYKICDPNDPNRTICNAVAGTPQLEGLSYEDTCYDGVDNDCDNNTDADDSECEGCGGGQSMRNLIPLNFVTGTLGIVIFSRRKRKRDRGAKKGGQS